MGGNAQNTYEWVTILRKNVPSPAALEFALRAIILLSKAKEKHSDAAGVKAGG